MLSICIPIYNPGRFLRPAIDSIFAQDYSNFELILVDDCSSTSIEEITDQYSDERIRLVRNTVNLGIPENWNRCLDLARGEYITIFHQDDVMLPGNLAQKVAVLEANPDLGFVYSNINLIDEDGMAVGGHSIDQPDADQIIAGWQFLQMVSMTGNPVACPSVMARTACLRQAGRFDARLKFTPDLEMWMRLAIESPIAYLAKPLVNMRRHANQETQRFLNTGKDYVDVLRAYDLIYSSPIPEPYARYRRQTYKTLSQQAYRMARWRLQKLKFHQVWLYLYVWFVSLIKTLRPGTMGS